MAEEIVAEATSFREKIEKNRRETDRKKLHEGGGINLLRKRKWGGKLKYRENGKEKTQTQIKEKKRPWRKAKRRIKETEIEKVEVSITESEKTEKTGRDWRKDRRQSVSPNILKMKKMFEKVAEKIGEK